VIVVQGKDDQRCLGLVTLAEAQCRSGVNASPSEANTREARRWPAGVGQLNLAFDRASALDLGGAVGQRCVGCGVVASH